MNESTRMNNSNICECGRYFSGFSKQTHCWECIRSFLKLKGYIKKAKELENV